MKNITKSATITTERGTVVNMTVNAIRGFAVVEEEVYNDGWNSTVKSNQVTEKTEIVLVINGKNYKGSFTTNMPASVLKGCYGVFLAGNQPIGLSKEKYNELTAIVSEARKEAETDQSWIDYSERKAKAEKEEREYYAHAKAVDNMMTLNGRTY